KHCDPSIDQVTMPTGSKLSTPGRARAFGTRLLKVLNSCTTPASVLTPVQLPVPSQASHACGSTSSGVTGKSGQRGSPIELCVKPPQGMARNWMLHCFQISSGRCQIVNEEPNVEGA